MIDEVISRAEEVFGNTNQAHDWMEKKSLTLGCSPETLCDTKEGCDKVLLHLHSIETYCDD